MAQTQRILLTSSALVAPKFHYTPCVKTGAIYTVSGMLGLIPATGLLVAGGVAAETRQILDNLKAALPDYGVSLEDMSIARIYTTRFAQFAAINSVWDEFFADLAPPARTSIGVAALPLAASVEIEFMFYKVD